MMSIWVMPLSYLIFHHWGLLPEYWCPRCKYVEAQLQATLTRAGIRQSHGQGP